MIDMRRILLACVCALAVLLTGCTADTDSSGPAPRTTADTFVQDLATAGIGVYAAGSTTPVLPVAEPGPVTYSSDEAAAAAASAAAHAGLSGADLDALVKTQPLTKGTEPIPSSLLIGAWSQVAPGPRAALAKKILGNQNWTHYQQIVFPSVVLTLFAADIAAPNGSAPTFDAPAGTSACETFKNAVFGTIDNVFAAIGRFEIKTFTGNVFTDILTFIRNLGALIGNAVLDGARIVLVNGVETALGPIVSAIATVATIAAVAGKIVDALQPWTSSFVLEPVISRRDTSAHRGKVTLTMKGVTGKEDWPDQIAGCARSVNVELPSLKPTGGKLDWTIPYQNPAPMIAKLTDTPMLDKNSTATMTFETLPESAEVAAGEEHTDGIAHVLVKVHRTDLDKLHELLSREALSLLPAVAQKIFGPALLALVDPQLKRLLTPLAQLRDQSVTAVVPVNYHGDPQPTASPSASPKGRLAHLKAGTCPQARTIGHRYSFLDSWHVPQSPPNTTLCSYVLPEHGTVQLFVGLNPYREQFKLRPGTRITLAGTDEAWVYSGCSNEPCWGLRANVGKNSLAIEGPQTRKIAEEIAANILAANP